MERRREGGRKDVVREQTQREGSSTLFGLQAKDNPLKF